MIRIRVNAGEGAQVCARELYAAVRERTRVWSMGDYRRTRNLKLVHTARNVTGTVRRVNASESASLEFECRAKDPAQEEITASRFVNLVFRYMDSASEITLWRK